MMEVRNTANQRHVEAQRAKEYIPGVVTGTKGHCHTEAQNLCHLANMMEVLTMCSTELCSVTQRH